MKTVKIQAMLLLLLVLGLGFVPGLREVVADGPQVNVPYVPQGSAINAAVFWFGAVDETSNYADVRLMYDDANLVVMLHIFDQWPWHNPAPNPATLTEWDAVSLYLDLGAAAGTSLTADSYRFEAQFSPFGRDGYQAAYQASGGTWQSGSLVFATNAAYRGNGYNGQDSRGWRVTFEIPFTTLGLDGPPAAGSSWAMALALHDRDDEAGTSIPDQRWPQSFNPASPASWGTLHIGMPTYASATSVTRSKTVIRHGEAGQIVPDAHVGGHSTCGAEFHPDYFGQWGTANYADYQQINIQNQWDLADWPCFSRYYVTFPLTLVPTGAAIISAALVMHQFGNAEPSLAEDSIIQVLTVADDWTEEAITWNNAPYADENVAATQVSPVSELPPWPGVRHTWDVSRAVAMAHQQGEPLRLALYSADTERHSGKYFTSSDTEDWNKEGRPTLMVTWGAALLLDETVYLPLILR